ncbi:MAG: OmpA family protein [Bacteroidota bacterium]
MHSPIGYGPSGALFFSEVSFDKGVYQGRVMKFIEKGNEAVEVSIPFLKNKSSVQSGSLSKDGRYMILSLESNNTYGVEDLYVVKKSGDGWSSPINLGADINTAYQEITPFLAVDNKTLFFSTNGREGEGSFDVFYSVRLDESWRNWSAPVNVGSEVNTTGAETSFSFQDGSTWAYFVSSQNSDGYGDIKRIKIKEDIEEDTVQLVTEEDIPLPTEKPEEILLKVIDKTSRESIPSVLVVNDTPIALPNGTFRIDSTFMLNNEVEIKASGYLPAMVSLDTTLMIGTNEVEMESIEVGSTITLKQVLFHRGSAEMMEGSEKELDLVVEMMNDDPKVKILLKGHTDNQGDPVLNVKLSESRVKSVKAYLIDQGIDPYRITGRGYGGNAPIASNGSEATRKLNRRVEFEVVER